MKVRVKVRDLLPNPFRNYQDYPTDPAKVAALDASIEKNEFWENLVGRESPAAPGNKYELGDGHSRLEVIRKKGEDFEFDLTVLPLTDQQMLRIMADANAVEWNSHRDHDRECIRATRRYLLEHPSEWQRKKKANIGTGPSARDIGAFLGWTETRVAQYLGIVIAEDNGEIERSIIEPLPLNKAHKLLARTRRRPVDEQQAVARLLNDEDELPVSQIPLGWHQANFTRHEAVEDARRYAREATRKIAVAYETVLKVSEALEAVLAAEAEIDAQQATVDMLFMELLRLWQVADRVLQWCQSRVPRPPRLKQDDPDDPFSSRPVIPDSDNPWIGHPAQPDDNEPTTSGAWGGDNVGTTSEAPEAIQQHQRRSQP